MGEGFELVEWGTEDGGGDSDEDDDVIPEKVGVARVAEALQVHVWPSMVMKKQDRPGRKQEDKEKTPENHEGSAEGKSGEGGAVEKQSSDEQNLGNSKEQSTPEVSQDESAPSSAAKNPSSQERIDSLLAEECEDVLASGLSDVQDPEGESFEKLFAKFAQMKGLLNYLNCSMSLRRSTCCLTPQLHCLQYQ